jgi:hypothetical protein
VLPPPLHPCQAWWQQANDGLGGEPHDLCLLLVRRLVHPPEGATRVCIGRRAWLPGAAAVVPAPSTDQLGCWRGNVGQLITVS